jgi:hypothetical protein
VINSVRFQTIDQAKRLSKKLSSLFFGEEEKKFHKIDTSDKLDKTFYSHNLLFFVISWSVCSNICDK